MQRSLVLKSKKVKSKRVKRVVLPRSAVRARLCRCSMRRIEHEKRALPYFYAGKNFVSLAELCIFAVVNV